MLQSKLLAKKKSSSQIQGLHSQSFQPTDQDELKSPYCVAVICKPLLENPAINNVVVLAELLEDAIQRHMAVSYRIKTLCTNATKNFFIFYGENHRDAYDRTDRRLSSETESYERSLQQPNLLDLVAIPKSLDILKGELMLLVRQRQNGRGALTIESTEVKFQMDAEILDPLDIGIYQIREANQMFEEIRNDIEAFSFVFLVVVCHVSFA